MNSPFAGRTVHTRFNILGPLEVIDQEGRPVELGRRKQRALLTLLLLSANRVISTERLIDLMWADGAPSKVANSLQSYVSNLRRALEPSRTPRGSAATIVSQPPGYLLRVEREDIDAAVFESMAAGGRTLLSQGEADAAHEVLQSALSLWRGPALHDFADESFAWGEASRLEELRLVVVESALESELAMQANSMAIVELKALVADYPSRERFWELLMLALYRSNRQAEALQSFQQARRVLADDYGVDPGPGLRYLEVAILTHEPALTWMPVDALGLRRHASLN